MTQETKLQRADGEGAPAWLATERSPLREPQVTQFELASGPLKINAVVRVTPIGLLTLSVLVLATSALVWTGTSVARKRASRPR